MQRGTMSQVRRRTKTHAHISRVVLPGVPAECSGQDTDSRRRTTSNFMVRCCPVPSEQQPQNRQPDPSARALHAEWELEFGRHRGTEVPIRSEVVPIKRWRCHSWFLRGRTVTRGGDAASESSDFGGGETSRGAAVNRAALGWGKRWRRRGLEDGEGVGGREEDG